VQIREGFYPDPPLVDHAIVLQGIGVDQHPRLEGMGINNLRFPLYDLPKLLSVSGLDFSGSIMYTTVAPAPRLLTLSFSHCSLDNGIEIRNDDADDIFLLSFSRCRLGYISSGVANQIVMEADTVDGVVSWFMPSAPSVSIRDCWFRGGNGPAIGLSGAPRGTIMGTRIENYDMGIYAEDAALTMDANVITNCGTGVYLGFSGDWAYITNNDIRDCDVAVRAVDWVYDMRVIGNRIIGGRSNGIWTQNVYRPIVERNIVGMHDGVGVVIDGMYISGTEYRATIRSNTVFGNGGSGIALNQQSPNIAIIEKNIVFGNGEWGATVWPGTVVQSRCNDWYGNRLGAVMGVAADSMDLSVDPLFCGADSADVRLNSSSPLLADSVACGQIGALGVGCGVTPTLVQRFTAGRVSGGIRVVWEVAEGATASEIWLERSEASSGEGWVRPTTERTLENRSVTELDRSAVDDRAYWYRLMALEGSNTGVIGAPIHVEAQARLESRLVEIGPNPGSGPVRIAFALKHAAAIEIDVFDVQGRKVAAPGSGMWAAGTHELVWDGRTRSGQPAPAGLYVIRYLYPGGQDRRGIVRIR
jgi:parallel beta helix pectate lyase-like protein/flagellar hook capping protein FlgD